MPEVLCMMSWVKRLAGFLFGGAILGAVIASLISPTFIAWDSTSAAGQALCNCVECVKNTTARLISAQLTGAAIGGIAMLILGIVILRAMGKRGDGGGDEPAAKLPASPSAPSGPPPVA
jgi:hypothetical protein